MQCYLLLSYANKGKRDTLRAYKLTKNKKINNKQIMKKIILTSAIIFATVAASFAQNSTPATEIQQRTDAATLNVILNPIQTLMVNSAQKTVDLEYKNKGDYANGVTSEQADHLTIYSTGAFAITVQSASNDIEKVIAGKTQSISASTIKIKASKGSSNSLGGASYSSVSLSTKPTDLISSGTGGVEKNFNVTYSGMGANGYVNIYFNDEKPTVYTTTVTYAIVAQ